MINPTTHKAGLPFGCACGKQAGTDSDVAQKLPRLPPYTHYILPSRYTTWGSVPLTPPGVVPRRHPCRAYRPPLSEGSFGANLPYHFIVRIPFASRFLLGLETLCCYRNNGKHRIRTGSSRNRIRQNTRNRGGTKMLGVRTERTCGGTQNVCSRAARLQYR